MVLENGLQDIVKADSPAAESPNDNAEARQDLRGERKSESGHLDGGSN